MLNRRTRVALACGVAVFALCTALPALAQEKSRFDIKAQPLATALDAFGVQSKKPILFTPDLAAGKGSAGVSGDLDPRDALAKLLAGTGLTFRETNGTILVVKAQPAPKTMGAELAPANEPARLPPLTSASVQTGDITEVVVTANKRIERLRDVPSSVTAVRADRLAETGMIKLEDYAARVPGLSVNNVAAGGGQNTVSLRGITTGPTGGPTVGIFVDDTPVNASTGLSGGGAVPDLDPSDLDRIEVLRGPQGTLYGGGSMGGLIKFVTKAPDYERLSARLQLDGSSVDHGGYGAGARAALNAPVTENVAIRASAFARRDAGYFDNLQTSQSDVNRGLYEGGRFSLGARLGEKVELRVSAMRQQSRVRANPVIDIDGTTFQPVYGDLQTRRAPGSDNSYGLNTVYDARLTADLGFADLVSVTGWNEARFVSNFDYSPVLSPLIAGLFGVNNAGAAVNSNRRTNKLSEEVRLSSKPGQAFSWQLGGFYTRESTKYAQNIRVFDGRTGNPLPMTLPPLGLVSIPQTFKEKAVFGNISYAFTPSFDVTVGIRHSNNDQDVIQSTGGALFGVSNAVLNSSDSATTYLINPRYRITDEVMVYARVASGYRAGGPNIVVLDVPATYAPDRVVNYEAGVKAELFNKALSFDLAAFHVTWTDIQLRQTSAVATSYYINGGKAHSRGLEGSATWRPVNGLSISGNLAYTQAELDRDLPQNIGKKGDRLPDTPRWAGQVSADYTFPVPLAGDWSGSVGTSYRHLGKRMAALEPGPYQLPAYDTVDLRASLQNDRYTITLFARNVGDERGYISAVRFGALQQIAVIQPRTVGVSVAAGF